MFQEKFPETPVPNKSTICRLIQRFRDTGNVMDRKRNRSATVLKEDKLLEIQEVLKHSPETSLSKLHQQCNVSLSSAYVATKKLKMRSYKWQTVQELKTPDRGARIHFCRWFRSFIQLGLHVLGTLFFSDEAWFHLDGNVNKQNCRLWSTSKPDATLQKPLHSSKVGVWCAISRRRIIGPIFFTETITSERYKDIIENFVSLLEEDERYCWFQQDGAPCHTANSSMNFLAEFFGERIVTKGLWPPRSPDLTPLDFFLWGFLKSKVYAKLLLKIYDATLRNLLGKSKKLLFNVLQQQY